MDYMTKQKSFLKKSTKIYKTAYLYLKRDAQGPQIKHFIPCQIWKSSYEEGNYQPCNLSDSVDTNDHELLRLPVSLTLQMSHVLSKKNQKIVLRYHW